MTLFSLPRSAVVTLALGLAPCAAWANSYTIVGIDHLPQAINDKGQVAADGYNGKSWRALVFSKGKWRNLPIHSTVGGINASGDVAGDFNDGPNIYQGYLHIRRGKTLIHINDDRRVRVFGLNNQRVVVGEFVDTRRCFAWSEEGGFVDFGLMNQGKHCIARAINESGQVTGKADTIEGSVGHAFIWQDGVFQDLGRLQGGGDTTGVAINIHGQVVGGSSFAGVAQHAFLWNGTALVALDPGVTYKSTLPYAINDVGEIVGYADKFNNHDPVAVRFAGGKVIPLATEVTNLGNWKLEFAEGINNDGAIIGRGNNGGFMLVPQERYVAPQAEVDPR